MIYPPNMVSINAISMSDTKFGEIYDMILESYPNACVLYIKEVRLLKKLNQSIYLIGIIT